MLEYHSISVLVQAAQDSGSTISALVLADRAAQFVGVTTREAGA